MPSTEENVYQLARSIHEFLYMDGSDNRLWEAMVNTETRFPESPIHHGTDWYMDFACYLLRQTKQGEYDLD